MSVFGTTIQAQGIISCFAHQFSEKFSPNAQHMFTYSAFADGIECKHYNQLQEDDE